MTAFNDTAKSTLSVETVEHNETSPVLVSRNFRRIALPSPKGTAAKVADNGRIRFGAAFRLPTSK